MDGRSVVGVATRADREATTVIGIGDLHSPELPEQVPSSGTRSSSLLLLDPVCGGRDDRQVIRTEGLRRAVARTWVLMLSELALVPEVGQDRRSCRPVTPLPGFTQPTEQAGFIQYGRPALPDQCMIPYDSPRPWRAVHESDSGALAAQGLTLALISMPHGLSSVHDPDPSAPRPVKMG